ncbi:hypothetical protein [Rhizobium binae]|uniref:hypothetical protein n=1 Tax=Rhizobium binae TaxID=1138190 RepID=UPI001C83BE13|nr:hypothetical protein [Rhizobium binae]MBX4926870.1 hypothetical protein [Rhizobium binae]
MTGGIAEWIGAAPAASFDASEVSAIKLVCSKRLTILCLMAIPPLARNSPKPERYLSRIAP